MKRRIDTTSFRFKLLKKYLFSSNTRKTKQQLEEPTEQQVKEHTKVQFNFCDDTLSLIFKYCNVKSLVHISHVCENWKSQIYENRICKIWTCEELIILLESDCEALVLRLLENEEKCIVATKDLNDLFGKACELGFYTLTKFLLSGSKVDPSFPNNYPILTASRNGHEKIVKLLLSHPKVNPAAENNWAIRLASTNGCDKVVKLLLKHPKVDPSANNDEAIGTSSNNGHDKVVKLLLKHPKVDPTANKHCAIINACLWGRVKVVKLLLEDGRSDPNADNNTPLEYASQCRSEEVLKLLLQDERTIVTPEIISKANERGKHKIFNLLLKHLQSQ